MQNAGAGLEVVEDPTATASGVRVLRSNLTDSNAADEWVKQYGASTNTAWIVHTVRSKCTRMVFHKVWVCQHNERNKTSEKRSTRCPAKLDIKIKKVNRDTKKNDAFLCREVPLQAVIKLVSQHNHSTESADALRMLRPSCETKAGFVQYFEEGLGPAEALRRHERNLAAMDRGVQLRANGMLNPAYRVVGHWHKHWVQAKYGRLSNPVAKLQEKMAQYAAQGKIPLHSTGGTIKHEIFLIKQTCILSAWKVVKKTTQSLHTSCCLCFTCAGAEVFTSSTQDDCWAVLVTTPIMRRAQLLNSAQETIFVDSTSSCDATQSTATVLLTATKAGAVPIAVLIHSSQSKEGYGLAFRLLRDCYPLCFGNSQAPAAFMTDNSQAEKGALKDTWALARQQLLCHFHVLQAEWRWLTATTNQVPQDQRQPMMAAFKKVLYAKEPGELEAAKEELFALPHEGYVCRAQALLKCEEQWVLLYRAGTLTRGQNTNNYSEASIRILKDDVLSRTKAYNAVALPAHRISLENLFPTVLDIDPQKIVQIDQALYRVPSSCGTVLYEVQADFGLCGGWAGSQGAFCKHQAIVQKAFGGGFPNSPELTPEDCEQLGLLALGERCPSRGFFLPLVPQVLGSAGPGAAAEPHCEDVAALAAAAETSQQPPVLEALPTPQVRCSTAAIFTTGEEHRSLQKRATA
ncbi:uncharacterized protein LOC144157796 [Haemaphysalis longicornis]